MIKLLKLLNHKLNVLFEADSYDVNEYLGEKWLCHTNQKEY